jgi:hypothetical protein
MNAKIPLTLTLAALVGFAAPALAAEHAAAKHDPQVATTTAKPKTQEKAAPAKETKAVKGRHAKAKSSKTAAATHKAPATTPAAAK